MPPPQAPLAIRDAYVATLTNASHLIQSRSGVSEMRRSGLLRINVAISRRSAAGVLPSRRPYESEWKRQEPSGGCATTRAVRVTIGCESWPRCFAFPTAHVASGCFSRAFLNHGQALSSCAPSHLWQQSFFRPSATQAFEESTFVGRRSASSAAAVARRPARRAVLRRSKWSSSSMATSRDKPRERSSRLPARPTMTLFELSAGLRHGSPRPWRRPCTTTASEAARVSADADARQPLAVPPRAATAPSPPRPPRASRCGPRRRMRTSTYLPVPRRRATGTCAGGRPSEAAVAPPPNDACCLPASRRRASSYRCRASASRVSRRGPPPSASAPVAAASEETLQASSSCGRVGGAPRFSRDSPRSAPSAPPSAWTSVTRVSVLFESLTPIRTFPLAEGRRR
mmetsp:Transcript_11948/g.42246  ORF Transcript_11948/g.42246 Transcript_11948/m.42246 type:complete len:399 (-) Transcript_11948:362-1558(-)